MSSRAVGSLLDRYYPIENGVRYRDGTAPFFSWLLSATPATSVVLNVGAGPTPDLARRLRGRFAQHFGVDPDPVVLTNTDLDEAFVNDGIALPFTDNSFDCVYSDWTVEHVGRPQEFLAEISRVLKPGGSYFFRTTNKLHYMTIVSAHTPHAFHRLVANRVRVLNEATHDPWPTRYRMNRPKPIRRIARAHGFKSVEIRMLESHPSYLMFNPVAFRSGVAYERLVNRFSFLEPFRLIILARLKKAAL